MGIIAIKGLLIGCGIQKNQATPTIRRKNGILILKSVPTITSTCNFIPTGGFSIFQKRIVQVIQNLICGKEAGIKLKFFWGGTKKSGKNQ